MGGGIDRALKWAFVAASLTWALALPLAAGAAATPHAPSGEYALATLAYAIGGVICHQQTARSLHLWGVQLPVCARCTGIYLGAALAAVVFVAARSFVARRHVVVGRPFPGRLAILASAALIGLTLAFEWTTGITPSNVVRALSGIPLGAAVAWVVLS